MKKLRTQKVKMRATTHSRTAATLGLPRNEQTPKAIARATVVLDVRRNIGGTAQKREEILPSTKIKASFIQKEMRRMRWSRKWMPRR